MKKIKGVLVVVLSTLFLAGCSQSQSLITATIGNSQKLKLEVVQTPERITQGLSNRDQLGADGMLFVFNQSRVPQFWMKEMRFDLDLIWIREMRVIEITKTVLAPAPTTPLNELPTYAPSQPVDMVLEVEAGNAEKWHLKIGDRLQIQSKKN